MIGNFTSHREGCVAVVGMLYKITYKCIYLTLSSNINFCTTTPQCVVYLLPSHCDVLLHDFYIAVYSYIYTF